ncbi:MAG: fumarylacetoacetate hydrolase family protein [Desulfohalobiaceae bacterium]|nr:fumarylacetoacetate hydrolase family protein [Desulfohalobiaceae bacterium]
MRIIRFMDETGQVRFGHDHQDGQALVLEGGLAKGFTETGQRAGVTKILAPLQPAVILGIGLNYHEHARETGLEAPKYPVLFMKNPASVVGPEDSVILPPSCMNPPQVDYEVELAVVLKKKARDVPLDKALDCVLGYTVGNDVSARRWQGVKGSGQWTRGKSFDTFCPLGPVLVTPDEIPDPQALALSCTLNNEMMQNGHTGDMIFSVAELIAFLSQSTTLLPGTVILTGTPSGVGFKRTPPVYLQDGDQLELTVEKIGTLRNPVRAEKGE